MIGIVVIVGAFFGYCYYGMQMQIEGVAASLTPAPEAMEVYDTVMDQLANEAFFGTIYQEGTEFLMPESFAFLTLTARMTNRGIFPMDWVRIEVTPDSADILQIEADRTPTLTAQSRADFSTTVLTRAGADTQREITITYYVLGRQMSVSYRMPR